MASKVNKVFLWEMFIAAICLFCVQTGAGNFSGKCVRKTFFCIMMCGHSGDTKILQFHNFKVKIMIEFCFGISDPVKKWKATQAKLEAAMLEDAAPVDADSDGDEDLDEVKT